MMARPFLLAVAGGLFMELTRVSVGTLSGSQSLVSGLNDSGELSKLCLNFC